MRKSAAAQKSLLYAALCTLLILIYIFAAMHAVTGENPLDYTYNSYLLQAQAWLRGETALDQNYSHLELALYNGEYYVSFPPTPSVFMLIPALIFGDHVPGGIFLKLYITAACLIVLGEIMRSKRLSPVRSVFWSLGICICSAMLPVSLVGGVWYEAQALAFLFAMSAISALRRDKPVIACLCYALGVGCRPFSVLLGPVLLAMYLEQHSSDPKKGILRLLPGIAAGLAVAAAYGAYNYIRFGNIFEFGHNYLPEFTRSDHGQLSLHYVPENFRQMLFGSPFWMQDGKPAFYPFGFSMFLSCPLLAVNLVWLVQDILKRRMNPVKWVCLLMGSLNVLMLLMHKTLGGHQFGLRYALELIPYCLCWYLVSPERRHMQKWTAALLIFGFIFNFTGGCLVHI